MTRSSHKRQATRGTSPSPREPSETCTAVADFDQIAKQVQKLLAPRLDVLEKRAGIRQLQSGNDAQGRSDISIDQSGQSPMRALP